MRSPLFAAVLAVALASTAHAQGGINLGWDNCRPYGISNVTFACNTNSGSRTLYVSFLPPANLDHLQSTEGNIDIVGSQLILPSWWNLGDPGHAGCRNTGFDSADFTAGPFDCLDPWGGQAASARGYTYIFNGDPDRERLHFVTTLPSSEAGVTAEDEYYCVKFTITYINTVGPGTCGSCVVPVCLVLQNLNLVQSGGNPSYLLANPIVSNWVTFNGQVPLCFPVPARNNTWGSVKALYR